MEDSYIFYAQIYLNEIAMEIARTCQKQMEKLHLGSVKPWNEITRQKPFFKWVAIAVLAEEPNTMQEKPQPQSAAEPQHNSNKNTAFCLARLNRHIPPSQLASAKKE